MINYGNILTYVNCFRIMALHINLLKTPVQPSQTFRPTFNFSHRTPKHLDYSHVYDAWLEEFNRVRGES